MINIFGFLSPLLRLMMFVVTMAALGVAHAQETQEASDAGDAGIVVAQDGSDDGPRMGSLFFTAGERMTLEILRRDAAMAELEEITKVFPVILHEEPFDGGEEVILARDAEFPLEVQALVRRHSDGKTFLWIGEENFDLHKDGRFLDQTEHIILNPGLVSPDGGIIGIDRISERRFRLRVGQSIDDEGRIRDNYPAIVVRNKKR